MGFFIFKNIKPWYYSPMFYLVFDIETIGKQYDDLDAFNLRIYGQ